MKRLNWSYWLGFCILIATGVLFLALTGKNSQAQSETNATSVEKALAAPTSTLFNYQGELLDSNGDPITSLVDLTFTLFATSTGGTACWSEDHSSGNAVNVQDGHFNVLLGQLTPMDNSCLTGDAYLELTINGELLEPRELLTSVAYAIEAHTIEANATTQGALNVNGGLYVRNIYGEGETGKAQIHMPSGPNQGNIYINNSTGKDLIFRGGTGSDKFTAHANGDVSLVGDLSLNGISLPFELLSDRSWAFEADGTANDTRLVLRSLTGGKAFEIANHEGDAVATFVAQGGTGGIGEFRVFGTTKLNDDATLDGTLDATGNINAINPNGSGSVFLGWDNDIARIRIAGSAPGAANGLDIQGPSNTSLMRIEGSGKVTIKELHITDTCTVAQSGNLTQTAANDNCSAGRIVSGAYVESNLMTREERNAGEIKRFEQGDVLCWAGDDGSLELCSQPNNSLVMGVADYSGMPIVLGAEPIKVIGSVQAGDYLVASDVPGYAMANDNPTFGIVIAQALENSNGESGLIQAMIRKM